MRTHASDGHIRPAPQGSQSLGQNSGRVPGGRRAQRADRPARAPTALRTAGKPHRTSVAAAAAQWTVQRAQGDRRKRHGFQRLIRIAAAPRPTTDVTQAHLDVSSTSFCLDQGINPQRLAEPSRSCADPPVQSVSWVIREQFRRPRCREHSRIWRLGAELAGPPTAAPPAEAVGNIHAS